MPDLVTLGLPVYNGERFLAQCLESLVRQTYRHCEIVVSDNASTDGTRAICEEFARRDRRLRYVRADRNRGTTWNHNRVFGLAHGALFKWCGADDAIAPHFVEACVTALERFPDAILAYPRTVVIDEAGEEIRRTTDRLPVDAPDPTVRFRSLLSALSVTQNVFYGVVRRDALARVRPLGVMLAADRCLLAELSLYGPFVEVPDHAMLRRQHVGNVRRSAEAERRQYDPTRTRSLTVRELRVLQSDLTAVLRCPLGPGARLRLLGVLVSWAVHARSTLIYEASAPLRRVWARVATRLAPSRIGAAQLIDAGDGNSA